MKIVYSSAACSRRRFRELFPVSRTMPGQQVQKYHRLMLEGLVRNGATVIGLSGPPVTRSNQKATIIRGSTDEENGVRYEHLPVVNIPFLKNLIVFFASFWRTMRHLRDDAEASVVCDVLNFSVSLGALLAAKILRRSNVAIVTDLPTLVSQRPNRLIAWLTGVAMSHYDGYVFLTEEMNSVVNRRHVPYVVIEGQVDITMDSRFNDLERKNPAFVCLYAGGLDRRYGVEILVRGFLQTTYAQAELHIYGRGDFEEDLLAVEKIDRRVKFFGNVPNEQVVENQLSAALLVNPRPTHEDFTRYSFPSKNMEYMSSGTPLLTTRLPGMPADYIPFVYLLEDETPTGIAAALENLFRTKREELHTKGREAKRFVLKHKNNTAQARRVLELVRTLVEMRGPYDA